MLLRQYVTKDYKHEHSFQFRNKTYLLHSVVTLTDEGQVYLNSAKKQAIITEHFFNWNGREFWTYEIGWAHGVNKPLKVSTDRSPDELIEDVAISASVAYSERETFGEQLPFYTAGIKHTKKDWEIPEVRVGWITLIATIIGVAIFKDWYVQFIIRIIAICIFIFYRQTYVSAYTTYTYDEDTEILRKKYEVLYGTEANKEDKASE